MPQSVTAAVSPHSFNPTIFREYDIRGVVGSTLFNEDAYYIGKAFASVASEIDEKGAVIIGRDGRDSSPAMTQALIKGVIDAGLDVVDIGVGPTPMLYFASKLLNAAGAVMVTV